MAGYKANVPFKVPVYILKPTYEKKKGVIQKIYPKPTQKHLIFCSFKTFGGTEVVKNDVVTVLNTAYVETWYNPNITAECILQTMDGTRYEIMGTPENIRMENQYMKFKVEAVKGSA